MHIKEISHAELLPRSNVPRAEEIGRDLARQAIKRFGLVPGSDDTQLKAKQMAANFHQAIVNAIDDEFKMKKMKSVGDS